MYSCTDRVIQFVRVYRWSIIVRYACTGREYEKVHLNRTMSRGACARASNVHARMHATNSHRHRKVRSRGQQKKLRAIVYQI